MQAVFIDDERVGQQLTLARAVACTQSSFEALAHGQAYNFTRKRDRVDVSELNVMWAFAPQLGLCGIKSYLTVGAGIAKGGELSLLLYAMDSGKLVAHVQANRLGQLRTAAATIVATQALARPQPQHLSVFGTGFQALFQTQALLDTFASLQKVSVVGRNNENSLKLKQSLNTRYPDKTIIISTAQEAASVADVIVTATASPKPLFDGAWLRPGVHINAIGSNNASRAELGRDVLERASRIIVDDLATAKQECGDLLINAWDFDGVSSLGEVLTGQACGRKDEQDISLFESQGLAIQDVYCAAKLIAKQNS